MSDTALASRASAGNRGAFDQAKFLAPLAFAVFLAVWEIAVRVFEVPAYLVPTPSDVAVKTWDDLASGLILRHFSITLGEVLVGFAIAALGGIALGTAIGLMPLLNRTIYPLILAFQTIPKIALAPLFLIWFGFGPTSKIITVATIVFFPVLVNVIAGLSTVDARRLVLMRALGASPLTAYRKVRFPSMLPFLFAGLEVAIVFSVTGAIVAEFIGASAGLGSLIIQRQSTSDVAGVFSVLVYLTIMGLVLHAALRAFGRHFTAWAQTERVMNS
jgi:NitT/TauT family transport system permease protein